MVGARTATPTAASPTPAVLTEPIAPPLVMRMLAGMPRRWGATGWWDGLTRRSDEWWRTGRRRAVVALGRGAIRQRRPILAIGIHFHVIGLEGGTRLRWARAAPTTGRASAFVHATRCVVVNSRRTRPCGSCPALPMEFVVSAPPCTRLFRALWCVAVLATHRSCFRAVVDDVAETRTTHALPALAQRNPSRPAPALRRCSSTLGMANAHQRVSHPQLHFQMRFAQLPRFVRHPGREPCLNRARNEGRGNGHSGFRRLSQRCFLVRRSFIPPFRGAHPAFGMTRSPASRDRRSVSPSPAVRR